MRKAFPKICLIAVLLLGVQPLYAAVYSFQPDPVDLNDLEHGYFYTWGIDWTVPEGIQSAYIEIAGINNNRWWDPKDENKIYIHLLDNPTLGVTEGLDTSVGDEFAGQGIWLTNFSDTNGGSYENWRYDFTGEQLAMLKTYGSDSRFGFSFDPDCWFNNDEITFTAAAPEPASLLLLGPALLGLLGLKRKQA